MIKIPSRIAGKKIVLRQLKPSDAASIFKHINDSAISKWTLMIPYPYPRNGAAVFIRRQAASRRKGSLITYGITPIGSEEIVGLVSLKKIEISKQMRRAELGYWLGKKFWGEGMMTEAVKLMLDLAFEKLKLHRIYAGVFEANTASLKVLKKSGLVKEGVFREARFRYGRWRNIIMMSILDSEYKRKKRK